MKSRAIIVLAIAAIGLGGARVGSPRCQPAAVRPEAARGLAELSEAYEALAAEIAPSVVQIFATGYAPRPGGGSGRDLLARQQNTGSGVILDPDGYVMTNAHVVAGAGRVQVLLSAPRGGGEELTSILRPRGELLGARVVGIDRETDLAVLRIDAEDLPALPLGDSDEVRQAQLVFAFGSPLGLESSVSVGIVSSVARQLRPEDPVVYIQTDAPINPGNSGGPLVNTGGEVIGINTFILSRSGGDEGIGFAVPSNIARNVFEQLRSTGRVRRGEIGVHAQTISPLLAAGLRLKRDWGVVLGDVLPGSAADEAGLRIGDVVLSLDGKPMENGRQFDVNLYRRTAGEIVTLELLRGPNRKTIRVPVSEEPDDPAGFVESLSPARNLVPPLGILAFDLEPQMLDRLPGLRRKSGVVVVARAANARYWEEGFVPGDIIHQINGKLVRGLTELRAVLADLGREDPVVLQIERQGVLRFVAIELE